MEVSMGVDSMSSESAQPPVDRAPVQACSDPETTKQRASTETEEGRCSPEDDGSLSPVPLPAVVRNEKEPELSDAEEHCAGLVDGDCERLEIIEPLPDCEERVLESHCTTTHIEEHNGLTAAPSDEMESLGVAAHGHHVYNCTGDHDDSAVPTSLPEDAQLCSVNGEPAEAVRYRVDEEVEGRGMRLSENDVETATRECDTKTDDCLQNINLDLGNIRQRFESPQESMTSVAHRCSLGRSESLLQRLEKYKSVASGDGNGDAQSSAKSEDEESPVVQDTSTKENVVYEGLSSLKNQWESGAVNSHQERVEETEEELAKLRKKTTKVLERFKFFENFKEQPKERKRFDKTPPRDTGKEPSPEFQVQRDPNVVRATNPAEEVVITDAARRLRERFRELEFNASREEPPQGPQPLKRITPPREYTRENAREASPDLQRDPDVVQCSYRVEDDIVVGADRAKSMRARFENSDAERVARENRRNEENGEEECLPMADTAKNLRAKFEAMRDESERREAERPKPRVDRFVVFPGTPNSEACATCNKKLYPMERMEVSGRLLHKTCFRCSHCSRPLRLESYTTNGGKLFCGPHFKQFLMAKGNYDEGFGREKWPRSASPASRESNEVYTHGDRDHMGILDQPAIA